LSQLKELRDLQLVSACLGFRTYSLMYLFNKPGELIMSLFPKDPNSIVFMNPLSTEGIYEMFQKWSHERGRPVSGAAIQALIEDTRG
jgi:hypothetical protein